MTTEHKTHADKHNLFSREKTREPYCTFKHVSWACNTQNSLNDTLHGGKHNIYILRAINFHK